LDREQLIDLLTTEDIIQIMKELGSPDYKTDSQGNLQFLTVCHGGNNYKLYYYVQSKLFQCYSCCGTMSIFDVIMSANNYNSDDFFQSFKYVCDFKGISLAKKQLKGLQKHQIENSDLQFLEKYLYKKDIQSLTLPSYNSCILNLFDNYMPLSWYNEGISEKIANYFNIMFYIAQNKAIIPHYDINGNLVGIRSRNFFQIELDKKKKYMPITIQNLTYKYPMGFNLYGLYQNKENIKKYKRIIIFESEKSVWLYGSYYGQENNIAVATCGMNLTLYQFNLILSLGVDEVILAYDKQYQIEYLDDEENIDYRSKEWKEYEGYIKTTIKIAEMFMGYCNISAISCWDTRLNYKDSPIDKGKDIFEELYIDRYIIEDTQELKEMIEHK